ncbi:hypothetical protein K470DRAFT_217410 [Piedraia hortae CBS 480.64]|uniref:Uncharacterized protein n=1 Tax=Piedraia hortae CBS 480.64 TaxID=1314780 RepID=A0A6A7BYY2_9PEZI|nr:hypothetical protein K470DRAFT_217410 [Piedraia hortae CBS 480.64]
MLIHLLLSLFLTTLVTASQELNIYSWPLSESSPTLFASLQYNTTSATVIKHSISTTSTPPDEKVRIGFYTSPAKTPSSWRGIVIASHSLTNPEPKKLLLHLNSKGEAYHIGLQPNYKPQQNGDLEIEVIPLKPGPQPVLNTPVAVKGDGSPVDGDGKDEQKTFLQKYWWVIVGFLILQVVAGGGARE